MSAPEDPSGTEPPRTSVFFSYARADRARVEPIIRTLEAEGFDVWWDGRLQTGARYARDIEQALTTADVVVVAWSRASVESDWVRDEAAHGRDRGRLAPILLDNVEPPLGFRQYQTTDLTARGARALNALATAIRSQAGQGPSPPQVRPGPHALPRRGMLLGAAGAGAIAVVGAGTWVWRGMAGASLDEHCVAVLPFANLSSDPQQTYFSEGLSEDIRARLANNPALKVIGEITSRRFGAANADGSRLARSLGVGLLLTGSVRKGGDTLRIAAELTDVATGIARWAHSFDRPVSDVFAVQNEIATAVNTALLRHIATGARAAAANAGSGATNVAAYEALLRGQALDRLDQSEQTEREALAEFDRAVNLDPNYAAAHAGRARALSAMAFSFAAAPEVARLFDQAVTAAEKASALAPDLADAQSTLGQVRFYGRLDARGARGPFDRARALDPNQPAVLSRFAGFAARTGRVKDADEAISTALALDPLNPLIYRNLGIIRVLERRFEDALPPLRKALELNPKLSAARAQAALALFGLGRLNEALQEAALEPIPMFMLSAQAILKHKLGDPAGARTAMETMVRDTGDASLYQQAEVLAQWGLTGQAVAALDRARTAHDAGLTACGVDFLLDPVRSLPAFRRLVGEIGVA